MCVGGGGGVSPVTSLFLVLGLLGGIFIFYFSLNFDRTDCKQTVKTLIV